MFRYSLPYIKEEHHLLQHFWRVSLAMLASIPKIILRIIYCMKLAWLLLVAITCSFTVALRNSLQPIGNRKMGVLPKTMKTEELHAAKCVTLTFASDPPLVTETNVISGRELLATNPGPFGTLLFVVRRPG